MAITRWSLVCVAVVVLSIARLAACADLVVGVCTHFGQDKGDVRRTVEALKRLGVASIRDDVHWRRVEKSKGSREVRGRVASLSGAVQELRVGSVSPLLILDYGNDFYDGGGFPRTADAQEAFADYAEAVVRDFGSQASMYEVWNEWNIGAGGYTGKRFGDAATYVSLLRTTYGRLKGIGDRKLVVLGGAVAGWDYAWIEEFAKNGGLQYLDGLSIHPYIFGNGDRNNPEILVERVGTLQHMLKPYTGGAEVPLYFTEIGWPNHRAKEGTEPQLAADYLARLYLIAAVVPSIKGVWWYDLVDDGPDPANREENFGLISSQYVEKPSFWALKAVSGLLKEARTVTRLASPRKTWTLKLELSEGQQALILWTSERRKASDRATLVGLPGADKGGAKIGPIWAEDGVNRPESHNGTELDLEVTGRPIVIRGNLQATSVRW